MFTASFVEPECKKMLQDALAAKRVTWPLLMNSCFIFKLTQATMPIENLRIVVRHLIQEDVKQNASAKCDNIIEHFFRVRGLPDQKEYDPVFARLLKKHKLVLPLTCDGRLACLWFGFVLRSSLTHLIPFFAVLVFFSFSIFSGHDEDDLRDYTHYRLSHPGSCLCYHCQAKQYEWQKNKEVWERKLSTPCFLSQDAFLFCPCLVLVANYCFHSLCIVMLIMCCSQVCVCGVPRRVSSSCHGI